MKRLIAMLIIFFSSYILSYSQSIQSLDIQAGGHLIKAQKLHNIGIVLTFAGLALTTLGVTSMAPEDKKPFLVVGAASLIFGVSLNISSFQHIGKAGKKMVAR